MELRPLKFVACSFDGMIGERLHANRKNWLAIAPLANPAMTKMFDHPNAPSDAYLNWSGEYAGKYLISAVQDLRMSHDGVLHRTASDVVRDLIRYQRENGGYLGPYGPADRIFGHGWDAWNHYHCLLGLLEWYRYAGDAQALDACCSITDYLCIRLGEPSALNRLKEPAKNFALSHVVAMLYRETERPAYLDLVRSFEQAWKTVALGGNYVEGFQAPTTLRALYGDDARWERLHSIQTLSELYRIGGDSTYLRALGNAWEGIRQFDRHVGGGFSSIELATGNPFDPRPIETCGTVGWMTITADFLQLTGAASAADELELSTWNAAPGAQCPDGSWWTYDTPMGGVDTAGMDPNGLFYPCNRVPSFAGHRHPTRYDLGWQDRTAGASLLSCCSANGPRAFGLLCEWAFMQSDDGIVVNFYGPCRATMALGNGNRVELEQVTDFPVSGRVALRLSTERPEPITVMLRIPAWSGRTTVTVAGESYEVPGGSYHAIQRPRWDGDVVTVDLDMAVRRSPGGPRPEDADPKSGPGATGRVALYRGPVLLAYDERDNPWPVESIPALGGGPVEFSILGAGSARSGPMVVGRASTDAMEVTLCDFASAGMPDLPPIAPPEVVGRTFQFGRLGGPVLAERVRLREGGKVDGHAHPNEAWWGWEGGLPVLGTAEGTVTTRFVWHTRENGKMVLRGRSEVDGTIVHELREVDLSVEGKWFQYSRGDGTVLAERMRLLADGSLSGYDNPNERRWERADELLTFYAEDGRPSTDFTATKSALGRIDYTGPSLFNPTITHRLAEIDLEVVGKEWQFERSAHPVPSLVSLMLRANGEIESDHPDESRWAWDGDTLVFYDAAGSATTRFTSVTKQRDDGRMLWVGSFVPNPAIQHMLREWNADLRWDQELRYVTWLPS
jgi:DUF1680 family protein